MGVCRNTGLDEPPEKLSNIVLQIESGDFSLLVGMSGVELAYEVLEQSNIGCERIKPNYTADRSDEFWTGWALSCDAVKGTVPSGFRLDGENGIEIIRDKKIMDLKKSGYVRNAAEAGKLSSRWSAMWETADVSAE